MSKAQVQGKKPAPRKKTGVAPARAAQADFSAYKRSIPAKRAHAAPQGPTAAQPKATTSPALFTYQRTTQTQSPDGTHIQSETRTIVVTKESLSSLASGTVNAVRSIAFYGASIVATVLGTQAYSPHGAPSALASEAAASRPAYMAPGAPRQRLPQLPVGTFIDNHPIG